MSTTSGVWSETTIQNIRERADAIMMDEQVKKQYIGQVESLKALYDNNNNKVNAIQSRKDKDLVVEVEWENACNIADAAGTACEFGGVELSSNIETYEFNINRVAEFYVKEKTYHTNDFGYAETIAKGILRAKKELDEYFNQQVITLLNTYVGPNALTTGMGTVVGNNTWILPAN